MILVIAAAGKRSTVMLMIDKVEHRDRLLLREGVILQIRFSIRLSTDLLKPTNVVQHHRYSVSASINALRLGT